MSTTTCGKGVITSGGWEKEEVRSFDPTLPPPDFWQHDRFASYSRRCFRRVTGMGTTLQALLSSARPYSRIGASVPAPHCSRLSRRSARAFRVLAATDRNYVTEITSLSLPFARKNIPSFFFGTKTRGIVESSMKICWKITVIGQWRESFLWEVKK